MVTLMIIGAIVGGLGLIACLVGIACDFEPAALTLGLIAFVAGLVMLVTGGIISSNQSDNRYRQNCEQLGGTPHIFRDGKICVKDSAVLNP